MSNLYSSKKTQTQNEVLTNLMDAVTSKADRESAQNENKAKTSYAADINPELLDELRKYTTKDEFKKILNPNTTVEELNDILTDVKKRLAPQDRKKFSIIITEIAIATGSENLLTANALSDILTMDNKKDETPTTKVLKDLERHHPLAQSNADFQDRFSKLLDYYQDIQNRYPPDSTTLKGIAEALIVVSIALREYHKAQEAKEAKEEEARAKAKEEQNIKEAKKREEQEKQPEKRQEKQLKDEQDNIATAMRYVYPSSNSAPEIREALQIYFNNKEEKPRTLKAYDEANRIEQRKKKEREKKESNNSLSA